MHRLVSGAVLAMVFGTGAAHANLVGNGNFETGDFTGWTAAGAVTVVENTSYLSYGGYYGDTGTGYVASFGMGNTYGGSISQTIATVAGDQYTLTFQYGAVGRYAEPQSIGVQAGDFETAVTSANAVPYDLNDALANYSYAFTASGSSTTVTFTDESAQSYGVDGFLDNIAVNAVTAVNTPEPASTLLLGSGLIGAALARSRRAGNAKSGPGGQA